MNTAGGGFSVIRRKELDSIVSGRKPIHATSDRRPRPAVTSQCHRLVAIVVVLAVALTERADGADPVPTTDHVSISAHFGFETGTRGLLASSSW